MDSLACLMYNLAQELSDGEPMSQQVIGHTWQRRHRIAPSLINATGVSGPAPRVFHGGRQTAWVLDYEFISFGRYRIRDASAHWHNREPRTAHLYPPRTIYWEDTRRVTGERNSAWLLFAGGAAIGAARLVRSRGYARFLDPDERLGRIIRRTAEIGQQSGETGFWEAQALLCEAIHLILAATPVQEATYLIPDERAMAPALPFSEEVDTFLKTHLSEKVSLNDIARHLHISTSFLSHRYKTATGRSPMTALTNLRLGHAKTLLLKGYPLKAIAAQLGFVDAFHLSKTFKRMEGTPPSEFAKNPRYANISRR